MFVRVDKCQRIATMVVTVSVLPLCLVRVDKCQRTATMVVTVSVLPL